MSIPQVLVARRDDRIIAHLVALAVVIHVVESIIPTPLPGAKPGLANVVTLYTRFRYGRRAALWVAFLRVIAGSIAAGTFLSPPFWLSLAGTTVSSLLLILLPTRRSWLGPVGISLLLAQSHMLGQFAVAQTLLIAHPALYHLLPPLLTFSLLAGVATGIAASHLLRITDNSAT